MVNAWDELEEHERPPKHLWTDGPRLNEWFREIRRKRKNDDGVDDPVENEAAKGLIVGG